MQTSYRDYVVRSVLNGIGPAIWFEHKDFDGISDDRCGYASTEAEAHDLIDDQIADWLEAVCKRRAALSELAAMCGEELAADLSNHRSE